MIVRKDLSTSYQSVQAGHAVAEYLLTYPNTEWRNGTIVYLLVNNEYEFRRLMFKLETKNIKYVKFIEPDINDQMTAMAAVTATNVFKNLKLL